MPRQPELISPSVPASPAPTPGASTGSENGSSSGLLPFGDPPAASGQGPHPIPPRIPRWLERSELFLRVMLRMYIGLAICYAPWSHMFWDQNPLFMHFPTLAVFAANGAVRGVISGLGLLNLWIALQDAIRHRDG